MQMTDEKYITTARKVVTTLKFHGDGESFGGALTLWITVEKYDIIFV